METHLTLACYEIGRNDDPAQSHRTTGDGLQVLPRLDSFSAQSRYFIPRDHLDIILLE